MSHVKEEYVSDWNTEEKDSKRKIYIDNVFINIYINIIIRKGGVLVDTLNFLLILSCYFLI